MHTFKDNSAIITKHRIKYSDELVIKNSVHTTIHLTIGHCENYISALHSKE